MREDNGSSTVQDYGSLPTEISESTDGASRLLRLADRARELDAGAVAEEARELSARVSEGRFYVACLVGLSEANPPCSTLWSATQLSRPVLFQSRRCLP